MDEATLIEGCINNDRHAQKALYEKYCNAMFTVSYRILNNRELANDSLQEAFIKIFKNISQFEGRSSLGAWIKQIVVRSCLLSIKKEEKYVLSKNDIEKTREEIFFPDTYTSKHIEKVILSLPQGYRTVFLLVEVEGYTHKEAAELMGISVGTSKSQLYHAKKELRNKLKEFMFND